MYKRTINNTDKNMAKLIESAFLVDDESGGYDLRINHKRKYRKSPYICFGARYFSAKNEIDFVHKNFFGRKK